MDTDGKTEVFLKNTDTLVRRLTAYILIVSCLFAALCTGGASAAYNYADFEKKCIAGWKTCSTDIDVSSCNISVKDIDEAVNRLFYENLEYYYVTHEYRYYYSSNIVRNITFFYEDYSKEKVNKVNAELSRLKGILDGFDSDLDKVLYAHEYLVDNIEYDMMLKKRSVYNCLIDKACVCEGYAKTFMLLMMKAGIGCKYVSSEENNHAWNMVLLDGEWYYVDVTWDNTAMTRRNLLMSRSECVRTGHKLTGNDWLINRAAFDSGICRSTKYDSAFFKDAAFTMTYYNGKWYYSDGRNICRVSSSGSDKEILKAVSDTWYVWGSDTRHYINGFSDAVIFEGRVYYNTPYSVRSMLSDGNDDKEEYRLSAQECLRGYIYDLSTAPDGVNYHLAQGPVSESEIVASGLVSNYEHVHIYTGSVTAPTCEKDGYTTFTCRCGYSYKGNYEPKTGHKKVTDSLVRATQTKNGKTAGSHCSVCKKVITKQNTIYKVSSVKLSKSAYTYNGKTQKPSVTVKDSKGKTLIKNTDYTVKYSDSKSKSTGKYTVTVTFKGKYSGTKKLSYTIAPKKISGVKLSSPSKKNIKVTFTKATGASAYQIYYSTRKSGGYKRLVSTSKTGFTYKKLTSGKTYYIKVRAYKKASDGSKIYGAFSSAKVVKIK